ncbi:hypothetical protein KP509_37G029100 [Ceratopteris richardii]|uniref:HAT C-terminal dimerisation domain-containing protein n=1 Tax=Ceratopteris richardii TaxID=49495 RepID=A0A8T2Q7Y2_CERRI|nr:hypothetical protein KP509_37G029100 [Ceratopteris richardii]
MMYLIDTIMIDIAGTFKKCSKRSKFLEALEFEFGCAILHMRRIHSVQWLSQTKIMLMKSQFLESPCFDVNARIVDDMGYGIIPDYGPLDGQLSAQLASMQGNMYRSMVVQRDLDGLDMEKAIASQKDFTNIVIENLMERFPDRGITSCFKALAPCTFPSGLEMKKRKQLESGELLDPLIDIVVVKREYQYSKAQASFEWKGRSLRDTWVAIGRNSTTREKYPMLLKLSHISMLQSSSTAACESGFSAQNLIKTNLWNSINTKNLDALMRIHIEGPPLQQFAFGDSVQLWKKGAKSRRIYGESMSVNLISLCIYFAGLIEYFKIEAHFQVLMLKNSSLYLQFYQCERICILYIS